jgi:hypothetical protein
MIDLKKPIESQYTAHDQRASEHVFKGRPIKGAPDYKAMIAHAKKRYSKTLAYLAK